MSHSVPFCPVFTFTPGPCTGGRSGSCVSGCVDLLVQGGHKGRPYDWQGGPMFLPPGLGGIFPWPGQTHRSAPTSNPVGQCSHRGRPYDGGWATRADTQVCPYEQPGRAREITRAAPEKGQAGPMTSGVWSCSYGGDGLCGLASGGLTWSELA